MSSAKPVTRRTSKRHGALQRPPVREGSAYLTALGERIRGLRARQGMTRRILAVQSGVSERFLAEVETGSGNPSVLTLRQLASALDVAPELLMIEGVAASVEFTHTTELLRELDEAELREAQQWLENKFGQDESRDRKQRVALVGLRGAGKSTIGGMLAKQMDCPFVELGRVIEKSS